MSEHRQRVDVSTASQLALCSCGWRVMRANRIAAREAIAEHVGNCHPDQLRTAQAALSALRRRNA